MASIQSARVSAHPRISKALGLVLVSLLAVVIMVGIGGLHAAAADSATFDNVQVSIQTSYDFPYSYTLTAYNTSGYQVAYYQSDFPAASLELPNGTYLFTVQASYNQAYSPCIGCTADPMLPATITSVTNAASATDSTAITNGTVTVLPVYRLASSSNEYGYALEQITGPSSITIDTQNASALPTTQVTVHVAYANGTAAQGAWVYASVVDDYYYYGSNIVSDVQTGANGTALLTMPQAPLLVSSYLSVPITLPQPQSNVTVMIGGQKVNVTVYWEPNSISLEGQTLIMPPQTSCNITLQYQPQQYYYPVSNGESSAPGAPGTTTTVTTTSAKTSQNTAQNRIPPFSPTDANVAASIGASIVTTTVAAQGLSKESLLQVGGVVLLAVILAALTFALVTVRENRKSNVVPA